MIVVTDRTVLDQQLKETITSFSSTPGVVAEIKNDAGSKKEFFDNIKLQQEFAPR